LNHGRFAKRNAPGLRPPAWLLWSKADITRPTIPADFVENDPGCVKTLCHCYDSPVILGETDEALR